MNRGQKIIAALLAALVVAVVIAAVVIIQNQQAAAAQTAYERCMTAHGSQDANTVDELLAIAEACSK